MPPSTAGGHSTPADPGSAQPPDSCPGNAEGSSHARRFTRPTTLLHDAVKAIEHRWRGAPAREDGDLDLFALEASLGDLRIFCTWLSECCRLHAMSNRAPEAFGRAALVHTAARFLHQAWMILPGAGACTGREPWENAHAGLVPHGARRVVVRSQPTAAVDEEALGLLAEASSALASGAGALAGQVPGPLPAVQACISAAAGQLRAAWQSAVTAHPAGLAERPGPAGPDTHAGNC